MNEPKETNFESPFYAHLDQLTADWRKCHAAGRPWLCVVQAPDVEEAPREAVSYGRVGEGRAYLILMDPLDRETLAKTIAVLQRIMEGIETPNALPQYLTNQAR